MDISTTCALCTHKAVCFARRKLNALNQELLDHTLVFESNKDFEQADEDMESALAAHCRYFTRKKSEWA